MSIFCIGLNKTGTTSLHEAFEVLGYRSLHWGGRQAFEAVQRAISESRDPLEDIAGYDAYSDIEPLARHFDIVDRWHPGSKFILNTRAVDAWLRSRGQHVQRNVERKARGEYDGRFLNVDVDRWRKLWDSHHARVREYFSGRSDLLEMDVPAGDGWGKLCPFLARPVPERPFPNLNAASV